MRSVEGDDDGQTDPRIGVEICPTLVAGLPIIFGLGKRLAIAGRCKDDWTSILGTRSETLLGPVSVLCLCSPCWLDLHMNTHGELRYNLDETIHLESRVSIR